MQGDRAQRDEAVRINTLMDNLNNLKSKLNNFTVMDELGQPIGEIQDLILDDTHQLNLVIATLGSAENKPSVLLNGRRIKKVSVQTHAVFVDIVRADVGFLPEYTPLESSDSRRDSFTNRAESNRSAPSQAAQPPLSYSAAAAAAAALMGGSAIAPPAPEDNLALEEDDLFTSDLLLPEPAADFAAIEDDLFTSDPPAPEDNLALEEDDLFTSDLLLPEPAADFAAIEDDLFTSDPPLPEPAADFAASVKMSSMESESLDDDWFADDEDDLATSAELPELSELELLPSEDLLLDSESTSDIAINNSLDDWSDLVNPTGQPSLDYALPSEAVPLPELANDDLLENPFALAEADEISELGFVEVGSAAWGQTAEPIDTFSGDPLAPLTDAEIESELEDLPDIGFLLDDSSVDAVNEDAEEFLLPSDFGEAGSTTDLTLESLPDRDPLSEPSLDDFRFPDIATAEISLDDFGFPDATTVSDDLASQVPNLDLNLGESLVDADSDLSWTDEIETGELFELNLDDSFNQPQMATDSELELELADLDLSATESIDLEFEADSGLDLETESDLEFETEYSGLDLETGLNLETGLDLETEAIAPLSLDFSLDDDFSNVVEPSAAIMDLSESEIPTSFIEVPMAAIAPMDSDSLANLELDTAFDVDLSLEDEFGTAGFAIGDINDLSEFTLQSDRFESEPETITSLTDLEFTGLPTDNLPTDDLTEMFGSVADLSFAEEGEFEDLSDLRSESVRDMALDSLFDNPVDNLESASDEFNFSTPSMGFVDPAAGMAAAPGILAGLAGLAAGRSPNLPIEETPALDIADISDLSDVSAQADSSLNDPAFSMSDVSMSDVSESDISEAIAPSSTLSIPSNSEPIVASLDDMVPLLEERLQVEYERRKVGEVIIRKKIETRMIQVPVRYEVLVIEQVSPEQKTLAEVDLSQGTFSDEVPAIAGKPTVSGEFKSAKTASAVIDAIAKTLRHQCKSIRIEIELDDSSLTQSYQDWLDRCSDL